ncbi:MAG TPA: type II toxin-antitoxin system Phd/YefM family antitoxin [Candidatus Limnocylindrales bacterium]|jgi:prevent-host-death family protein|nr:type II toxin-antitoxin system Phd/YefM family antitoxin [Candidatus Limnocylindrales bacterium]
MSKRQVNVHAAKTHLSRLLEEVEAGEEIVLARSGRPVARLIPFKPRREPRVPGAWRGRIRMAPDFDATPDELTASFGT